MPIAMIKTPSSLILNFTGLTKTIPCGPLYDKVLAMIAEGKSDAEVLNMIDPAARINSSGMFSVNEDGEVEIKGETLPDSLGNRIIDFANNGIPFLPLVKFWENCKLNPDPRAKSDLYKFLEHNGHPITSDGCFVAYRSVKRDVNGNLIDWHTGNFNNSVGQIVTMDRAECDNNPEQVCSRGLHVAAMEYAIDFERNEDRVMIEVKVNPRDVVAIPTDYNGQKMRVCQFQVAAINKELLAAPCYDPENIQDEDEILDEDEVWNDDEQEMVTTAPRKGNDNYKTQKRDKYGHFVKGSSPSPKNLRRDNKGRFI